jgi:hypothetical protein
MAVTSIALISSPPYRRSAALTTYEKLSIADSPAANVPTWRSASGGLEVYSRLSIASLVKERGTRRTSWSRPPQSLTIHAVKMMVSPLVATGLSAT